jgi:starch-binding outer membrane protein, SusD/RagB family
MKNFIYLFLLSVLFCISACTELVEPLPQDELYTDEQFYSHPEFVEGLLMKAYKELPSNYNFETDVASDDGVTNIVGSNFSLLATGGWQASFNPFSKWENAYEQIYYINLFLENYESVPWASDPQISQEDRDLKEELHLKRLKGEAHGLRAWYQFQLLQNHSGFSDDGRLLGFVILKEPLEVSDNWELPRNTFDECVEAIMVDLDTAIANLPFFYENAGGIIRETSGSRFENRINGSAAKALKSRLALLAASPAFSSADVISWEKAATISGDVLSELGALYLNGIEFYTQKQNSEIIWNLAERTINVWENSNFPPSLFGNGNTNPSQNLVDVFPMQNGYPIDHALSDYKVNDPYSSRDPRLSKYIIYNGALLKDQLINTYIGAPMDGINSLRSSTRTGYYLKKFMSEQVNLEPGNKSTSSHTYTLFRATEVLLNFAEAANEAWGPDGDPNGYGFTARSKIQELRERAGITQPDDYLASLDADGLRELIKNERRIELCFEGFRFWDIRRWEDIETMNAPVTGVNIVKDGIDFEFSFPQVEKREFADHMLYGPIPYKETRIYSIEQNNGW